MSKLSDEILVSKSIENIDYFGELVERYERKLLFYILRISSLNEMEAEEVIQDIFLKAWKNLHGFDPDLKFSTWIYRIAHNETISTFRKIQSRGQDKKVDIEPEYLESFASDLDFLKDLDQDFKASQIQTILNQMRPKYREVLILKYFEDQSYESIGDILKKPSGTVATLISRAKKEFESIVVKNAVNL